MRSPKPLSLSTANAGLPHTIHHPAARSREDRQEKRGDLSLWVCPTEVPEPRFSTASGAFFDLTLEAVRAYFRTHLQVQ